MNKTELIEALATRTDTSKTQTAKILNELLEIIQERLVNDDAVQLVGFGSFSVNKRAARQGRNPATGKTMTIPAKKVVKFKPGKTLADAADSKKPKKADKAVKSKKTKKKKK